MKNCIGGEVKQVSWDQLVELCPAGFRIKLCDMGASVDAIVAYRVDQMDSSVFGQLHFVAVGPTRTHKTVEKAMKERLGDVPSRFAYAFAYWSRY